MVERTKTVRAGYEAFNAEGLEAALPYYTPDCEVHSAPGWPGKPLYVGHDGFRELVNEWTENFERYRWDLREVLELPDGRVLVLAEHRGSIRGTDEEVSQPLAALHAFEGDRTASVEYFFGWNEAREAAGLSG